MSDRMKGIHEHDHCGPKLLFVVGGFGVGGTERHLSLVLPALWRAGWRVHVCALGDDGPMSAPLRQAGIPIEAISQRFWTGLPKLRVDRKSTRLNSSH